MNIVERPLARLDLLDIALFFEEAYSLDKADEFFNAAGDTYQTLAQMPQIGSPRPDYSPRIPELRQWRVKGFEDYLIFYRPLPSGGGVEIVRVLHSKRDIPPILHGER